VFQSHMEVSLTNSGPITIILENWALKKRNISYHSSEPVLLTRLFILLKLSCKPACFSHASQTYSIQI
jgi:hypothetical protein